MFIGCIDLSKESAFDFLDFFCIVFLFSTSALILFSLDYFGFMFSSFLKRKLRLVIVDLSAFLLIHSVLNLKVDIFQALCQGKNQETVLDIMHNVTGFSGMYYNSESSI